MQVSMRVSDKVTVVAEGEDQQEVFENLASMQEVFGEAKCGKCGGENLRFQVRKDKEDNKYYELICKNKNGTGWCNAKFAFGCHKKGGGLFPQRKDKEDKYKPNGGWTVYNKETQKEE